MSSDGDSGGSGSGSGSGSGKGGGNSGFKGLFGSLAKAIGGAFVEGLERQMREHLVGELSNPNLAARNATAKRLRIALARKEFAFPTEVRAKLDAMVMQALASADARPLVEALVTAVRDSGWKPMQRLMFYQIIAPHPSVNIGGQSGGSTAAPVPADNLPPKPPPADRPDYLKVVPIGGSSEATSSNTVTVTDPDSESAATSDSEDSPAAVDVDALPTTPPKLTVISPSDAAPEATSDVAPNTANETGDQAPDAATPADGDINSGADHTDPDAPTR